VKRLAAGLQAAAAAGVSYLDTLLVEPAAPSSSTPQGAARAHLATTEPDYLIAHLLAHLQTRDGMPQELRRAWGDDSIAWSLLSLAAAELAYLGSAELIAERASLQVRTEDLPGIPGVPGLPGLSGLSGIPRTPGISGKGATVTHEQALVPMLERAERAARAGARAARIATGAIPVQAKLAYQHASAKRGGATSDKLAALALYWMASAHSRTAVMLARN
jgi:hypothetical protein